MKPARRMRLTQSMTPGRIGRRVRDALELLLVHELEERRDALAARGGIVIGGRAAWPARLRGRSPAPVRPHSASGVIVPSMSSSISRVRPRRRREDVVERRRGLALGLVHRHDLLHVQAAGRARPGVDDAGHFVGHRGQVEQRLAVVLQRTDVDLGQPRAGAVGVDEQADVDAVASLEAQCLEQARRAPRSARPGAARSGRSRERTPSASAWPSTRSPGRRPGRSGPSRSRPRRASGAGTGR